MSDTIEKIKEFFGFKEESEEHIENSILSEKIEDQKKPVNSTKSFKTSFLNTSSTHKPVFEIKVEEPRIYEDSLVIASLLRESKPVVVSLKYLDKETSKRLVDFVCGTAYAINGHMMKIGENIFLFTPSSIGISNTQEKQIEIKEKEVIPQHIRKVSGL